MAATLLAADEPDALVLRPAGEWLVVSAADLDRRLNALPLPERRRVRFDLSGIDRLDSTGAWLLLRTEHALAALGNEVTMVNLLPRFVPLLDQVRARGAVEPMPHPIPPHHTFIGFVARI